MINRTACNHAFEGHQGGHFVLRVWVKHYTFENCTHTHTATWVPAFEILVLHLEVLKIVGTLIQKVVVLGHCFGVLVWSLITSADCWDWKKRAKKKQTEKKKEKPLCKMTQKESWKSLIHTKNPGSSSCPLSLLFKKQFSPMYSLHPVVMWWRLWISLWISTTQ